MSAHRTARIPYGPDDIVAPTKYRLIKRLGRGGFAEVWEAQNSFMDRIDAIKIFLPRVVESGRFTAQEVAKEARIPNALRQRTPHVADVFDAGITDLGLPYIVMELLTGSTLREHVAKRARERRRFDVENIVAIGFEVVHPLAVAHSLGVVHLDVKPDNIFLAKQHDQGVETTIAKVLDFGIAQLVEKNDGAVAGAGLVGTPRYAAPEQFSRRRGAVGAWTDTYATGHVLYEVAAGHPTFEPPGVTLDREALEHAQLYVEPSDLRELRPDLPGVLIELIHRCLRKRPEERPQSAHELAAALSKLDEALRGKRSIVSIPAISDFDIPFEAFTFNTTTQRSPAPSPVVVPRPELAQVVHGPGYVSPHSITDVPGTPLASANVSESFLTDPPPTVSSATPVMGTPAVAVGSITLPLGAPALGARPLQRTTLRIQTPAPPPVEAATVNEVAPRAVPSTPRIFDERTDPDGPPMFFDDPPAIEIRRAPTSRPAESSRSIPASARAASPASSARTETYDDVFAASPIEDQPPQRKRHLPRYPIRPGSGPMTKDGSATGSASLRPVSQRTAITEDRAPEVPLARRSWLGPVAVAASIVVLGIATAVAALRPASTSSATSVETAAAPSSTPPPVSVAPATASAPAVSVAAAPQSASAAPTAPSASTSASAAPSTRAKPLPFVAPPRPVVSVAPAEPPGPTDLKHEMRTPD